MALASGHARQARYDRGMINILLSFIGETGWSARAMAKITAIVLGAVIALSVLIAVLSAVARFAFFGGGMDMMNSITHTSAPLTGRSAMVSGYGGGGMVEMAADMAYPADDGFGEKMMVSGGFSASSIAPMPMMAVNGSRNAEKYERTDYSAIFTTRHFTETCDAVEAWKPLEYVLFDSANRSERNCWYSFRVEEKRADDILAQLKALKPDDMSVNVQTVAQSIENTADRIVILKRRLASTDATLAAAERAYDEAIGATRGSAVAGLGSLVTSKLSTIERLTNEKLSIEEQIRMLEQGKDSQMNDTAYTHFSVSASKTSFIDWKSLGEKWRYALQQAVNDISDILAAIVFMIPVIALRIVWYILAALIGIIAVVVFARVARTIILTIWRRGMRE